jgi:hypothetical protein
VKDKLIAQGAWPGSGGPRVNTEEEDFKVSSAPAMLRPPVHLPRPHLTVHILTPERL